MGKFNSKDNEKDPLKDPTYCTKCGKYGKSVTPISIDGQHVCFSLTCITCTVDNHDGRFISLFTYVPGTTRADFSGNWIKTPPGISKEAVRRCCEKSPLRRDFAAAEVQEEENRLFF